ANTVSLCPHCGRDCAARYLENMDGIWLEVDCPDHGLTCEQVENDPRFFKQAYAEHYEKPFDHLVLPVTYRCNLSCKYCYSCSNTSLPLPKDRPAERILDIIAKEEANVTLIGGEPTVRRDLADLISTAKRIQGAPKISLGTNGQKLSDISYLRNLQASGLDFVFLSLNDIAYDQSETIRGKKMQALANCAKLRLPVWLHQTIDDLSQIDSLHEVLIDYKSAIFNTTLRVVKSFGYRNAAKPIFLSQVLKYLDKQDAQAKGTNPFNRFVDLHGLPVKVCSWVNDMARLDPIDSKYLISDDTVTTFHRGMKLDELLLCGKA
ncbi:MAG: radical SAM protein, partial [Actinomycetia bacterium]|nr:radical SAM protein [Actinomycetes bacterium]